MDSNPSNTPATADADKTAVHKHEPMLQPPFRLGEQFPGGLVPWHPAEAPNLLGHYPNARTTGSLRRCGFCGSMHPTDLTAAIREGARLSWADQKYGWPHKVYVENIPNPHAGMPESRMSCSHAVPFCPQTGTPCSKGEQSSHNPPGDCCMSVCPDQVLTGSTKDGHPLILMQDGYNQRTGKPTYGWHEAGRPAAATTHGKFYTLHLQDATAEERKVIERAMGLSFCFHEGKIWWAGYREEGLSPQAVTEERK